MYKITKSKLDNIIFSNIIDEIKCKLALNAFKNKEAL